MPSKLLSDLKIKSAIKKPGRYSDGDGLMLVVKHSGACSWVLRIQVDGRRRDFGLGRLADVKAGAAREKADAIRKQYLSGIDPVEAKRAAKREKASIPTFAEAARLAHGEHKGGWKNAKHKAQWLSSLEAYAFPAIGQVRVDKVEGPAVRDLLAEIWLAKPETASRVRQRIGTVLDWAFAKGYRQAEAPMKSISRGLPRQPKKDWHFAALPYEDAPAIMAKLAQKDSVGRLALRFLILTAARSGEVRGATWAEIDKDQKVWTVPAERMKAGKAHIVPLSPPALAILDHMEKAFGDGSGDDNDGELGGTSDALIFPGNKGKPLSDMTLTKVVRDGFTQSITVHGFRSTFRDWAAEQTDVAGEVVEAALAHTISNKVEAAYRRTNYLEKRRDLMLRWAEYLSTSERAPQPTDKTDIR